MNIQSGAIVFILIRLNITVHQFQTRLLIFQKFAVHCNI
jgi:hypothetical protein